MYVNVIRPLFLQRSDLHPFSRTGHCVELLLQGQRQLLLFPLTQDRSSFLEALEHRKASLGGLQTLALPPLQPGRCCSQPGEEQLPSFGPFGHVGLMSADRRRFLRLSQVLQPELLHERRRSNTQQVDALLTPS